MFGNPKKYQEQCGIWAPSHPTPPLRGSREMENISRGLTFRDFVTILTEASMQDVTVPKLLSTGVQSPLYLLF
jgi:hypothetical protein